MKKMMTNMKTLVALLMAGAAVTSCSSDNEMDSLKAPAGKTYTMTVQATKGGDAMTRALADGGDGTLTATWATTENVYVMKGSDWATGSLKPQAAGASTTLKGELSGVTIAANDVLTLQFPKSGDITYAGQKGTLADIAAKYDYATATVTVKSVSGGDIIPEAATTTFQHQQAIVKFTLVDKANTSTKLSPTALTINDGTSDIVTLTSIPNATYTTNGEGVLYVALPAVSSKPITLTATVGSDTYNLTTSSAKSFANGSFYRVTAKMAKQTTVPDGAISGKFTINASGDKVYFSKGNLQATYNGTDWTWAFAENQWDYIGNAAGNTSINGNGTVSASNVTVDLFGWVGASSTWTGAAQYGITSSSATNNTNGYGNNASEALKSDWGNTIGSGWRTLTSDEWQWMLGPYSVTPNPGTNCRTSSTIGGVANARWVKAVVHSTKGLIIYPDALTWNDATMGTAPTTSNTANNDFTYNTLTDAQWSALEAAGCVFLPAAGFRSQATVAFAGSRGGYWSSSPNSEYYANRVYFISGNLNPAFGSNRYGGNSVRLVREVAAPAPAYKLLSDATAEDIGKVVCAAGHLHDAKTAVPTGCTAVGILGKVTETGHGLILALKDATSQYWNTINGWTSVTTYASTTLKVLPDDAARGTNLTSYTTLGETTVSNWAVAQKSDYEAIFTNLGSTINNFGTTYDDNVNAYITTGVGGTTISGVYWSATEDDDSFAWDFDSDCWGSNFKTRSYSVRPVLAF